MKRCTIGGIFVTLVTIVAFPAFSQSTTQENQRGGDCSVNITGNGNTASLMCTSVDAKLAKQVRAILNGTRRNESAVKEMSEKLDRILKQMDKETIPPQVGLRFVYPKSPALILVNQTAAIAKNIKWTLVLWNMDLPDRDNPLPIPVSSFDWLRPNGESGPLNLFDSPTISPLLKPGNRLYGSASVSCPECSRGRTYFVYIVWGEGGWFAEVQNEQSGDVIVPNNFSKATRTEYLKMVERVPPQSKTPIAGLRGD
jgi:hypothetical protein